MIVLGIDPGLARLGWSIILNELNTQKLITYGCITTSKTEETSQRLLIIYRKLEEIIKQYQPDMVCIEKLFFNTNAKTAFIVGEARGVIKICSLLHNTPVTEFTPLQIKNSIVGYGRADKSQIQNMVKVILKLDKIPEPDDTADAVAIGLAYCYYNKNLAEINK
jgi:crossover junction endodeoxyribonuclease RuvC